MNQSQGLFWMNNTNMDIVAVVWYGPINRAYSRSLNSGSMRLRFLIHRVGL